jgi:hypothetical protein
VRTSKEMTVARATLDEEHEKIKSQDALDHNNYVLGRVHTQYATAACLHAFLFALHSMAFEATWTNIECS